MSIEDAYQTLYSVALLVFAVLLIIMLVRAARGPGVPDRLLSINMIGTLVIASILVLSSLLSELWLVDVALTYTMISLISVVILARVYIPDESERSPFRKQEEEDTDGE